MVPSPTPSNNSPDTAVLDLWRAVRHGDEVAAAEAAMRLPVLESPHPRNDLGRLMAELWWTCEEVLTVHADVHSPDDLAVMAAVQDWTWDLLQRLVRGAEAGMWRGAA